MMMTIGDDWCLHGVIDDDVAPMTEGTVTDGIAPDHHHRWGRGSAVVICLCRLGIVYSHDYIVDTLWEAVTHYTRPTLPHCPLLLVCGAQTREVCFITVQ